VHYFRVQEFRDILYGSIEKHTVEAICKNSRWRIKCRLSTPRESIVDGLSSEKKAERLSHCPGQFDEILNPQRKTARFDSWGTHRLNTTTTIMI
jgi:hypothetical protein